MARVYATGKVVYGCASGARRSYRIGQLGNCLSGPRVQAVVVRARLAAYGLQRCGVDTGNTTVVVRRLRNGTVLASEPATTMPAGPESYQTVDSLVLGSAGAVGWIAEETSLGTSTRHAEVHRLDKHGFALLDSGGSIALHSLRLKRDTMTWKHGGVVRSARLG